MVDQFWAFLFVLHLVGIVQCSELKFSTKDEQKLKYLSPKAERVRADLGPVDVGAEIHATMEAAALKALSIIESASKLSEDTEKELDGIDGLSKVRIRRQKDENNFAVEDHIPVAARVIEKEEGYEPEHFEADYEAVIQQGIESNPILRSNIQNIAFDHKSKVSLPDSERVAEDEVEIDYVSLKNDYPRQKNSPRADAVRKVHGDKRQHQLKDEKFHPRGEKVSEDGLNQYGDYDYGDSDSSSGSKDGGEVKKTLPAEKMDTMIDLMNKLNKDFGLILNKWDSAPALKDEKGSKDGKDKDTKKDSKDAKGSKSDYDYGFGSPAEVVEPKQTSADSVKSHKKKKNMSPKNYVKM